MSEQPLHVGVTGHRVLADVDVLRTEVDRALEAIERAFPSRQLVALSQLAEGADRLVAERLLARPGSELIAVLPRPRASYLEDFSSAESRGEFRRLCDAAQRTVELPAAGGRDEGYDAANRYMLEHCDVLLAVWNGQAPPGRVGTGAVVARARRIGHPLAWVHAGNRRPGTHDPTQPGSQQGGLTLENWCR